jgi:hypothetical protein
MHLVSLPMVGLVQPCFSPGHDETPMLPPASGNMMSFAIRPV